MEAVLATGGGVDPGHHAAILAVSQSVFDAMREKDEEKLRAAFTVEVVFIVVDPDTGTSITFGSPDGFIASVMGSPDELRERIWDPEIRVDGDLATLWAPYEFYRGETFSHGGYDSFQLVRSDEGWKIVSVAFTRQR